MRMMPEDVRDRVVTELDELTERIFKLGSFLYNEEKVKQLSAEQYKLMKKQLKFMEGYRGVLIQRLEED